jgi:glutathione S-transferase
VIGLTAHPTLYCATIDADSLAVRILLALRAIRYNHVVIDSFPGTDADSRRHLDLAPGSDLPILQLGASTSGGLDAVLRAIAAMPAGLSIGHDGPDVRRWLDFATGPLRAATRARQAALLGDGATQADILHARSAILAIEDELALRRLDGRLWITDDRSGPTIADLAIYPAVALCRDFGLEHHEFPAIRQWLRRIHLLAPTVAMPGILDPT